MDLNECIKEVFYSFTINNVNVRILQVSF